MRQNATNTPLLRQPERYNPAHSDVHYTHVKTPANCAWASSLILNKAFMKREFDIYGLGAALVDTEITLDDADLHRMQVEKGVMTLVDEERQHVLIEHLKEHLVASKRASGGSAANSIIGAGHFGCRNFYSCKVADDDNGRFYLNDIAAAGVVTPPHLAAAEGITGKCLVMITPDAERTMNTYLGISGSLSEAEIDFEAIAKAEMVYIEGYLVTSPSGRAAAIKMREQARRVGTRVAISLSDPAMVQFFRDGLLEMIGDGVDLIFCNREEAMQFAGAATIDDACNELQKYAKTFAITCGPDGAVVFDGQKLSQVDAPTVTAIDTNGAGDMFAGAFMYGLTQGLSFEFAGRFAANAAAKVVTQYGPRLRPEQYEELKRGFF